MNTPNYNSFIPPKWVFIDLDDTLWDFHANSEIALRYVYDTTPYIRTQFSDYTDFSDLYHYHNDRLWEMYHHGEIDALTLKQERFEVLFRENSPADAARMSNLINNAYLTHLSKQTGIVDGAERLLQRLSAKYMIGILSNGFIEVQYKKLFNTPLWRYVQRMVVSDEIGVTKPDIRLFRYAEQAVGIDSSRAVMIGDNPDADIAGAVNAGWKAIYFDRRNRPLQLDGVKRVSRLDEIEL